METQAQNLAGGTTIVPEVPTLQDVPNEIAPIEGGKKCKKGSRKGSDGKCHRSSSGPRVSKPKSSCASRTRKTCYYDPNCTYAKGSKNRKGSCRAKPGAASNNLYEGPVFMAGETIEGGASSCTTRNRSTCYYDPNCAWKKGSKTRKGSKTIRRKGSCRARPGGAKGLYEGPVFRAGEINEIQAGEITELQAGKRRSKGSISQLQARAHKLCVKASGSKAAIRQRIKSAKKSKKATAKRCARK